MKTTSQLFAALLCCFGSSVLFADDVDEAIGVIAKVGPGAAGSSAARQARDRLTAEGPEILPRLLVVMDTSNSVAANWYRTAFDAIADREFAKPTPRLPRPAIEKFVLDAARNGRARRLGFAVLERIDATSREQLLPLWLDDAEFRRDAIDHALRLGDRSQKDNEVDRAKELFERAFRHARDSDQVLQAAAKLKGVGQEVDPVSHLGFVTHWRLLGPFPAAGTSGFATAFPPETKLDLAAEYDGADGKPIRWKPHQTTDRLGEVNLITAIGAVKESVGYAFAELDSPRDLAIQLRCSADDNLTVWLNGQKVLAREQWLNGTRLDRFVTPVTLQKGRNVVLVKICQGPQHVNPEVPNNWSFQLRLCDQSGAAAEFRNLHPATE